MIAIVVLAAALHAAAAAPNEAIEVEAVEVVEPEKAQAAATPGKAEHVQATEVAQEEAAPERGPWLGRLHPLLVHMPLAWMILLVAVDALTFFLGRRELEKPGYWLAGLTLASLVPAITTGLINAGDDTDALVMRHRNLMLMVCACVTLAFMLRVLRKNALGGAARTAYLVLVFLAAALITVGGHLGGAIVYGEDFLF